MKPGPDDDVPLELEVLERMLTVQCWGFCGFVGCPATGLSSLDGYRPWQQNVELWEGPVRPEPFTWDEIPGIDIR